MPGFGEKHVFGVAVAFQIMGMFITTANVAVVSLYVATMTLYHIC